MMRAPARILVLLVAASVAGTVSAAAEEPRLPGKKPGVTVGKMPPRKPMARPRLPAPKPQREPVRDARPEPAPAPDAAETAETAAIAPDEAALAACEAELARLGAVYERREAIAGDGGCGVAAPYNLRQIGEVVVKPDTELACGTALAAVRWVREVAEPAAAMLGPGVRLAEVTHASTYVCRNRNNSEAGKVSAHASGTAIDVAGFDLDGHGPVPVVPRKGDGSLEEGFQRAVRAGACLHFTTVLGPGSDAYHDDHLHLDTIRRSSGYRICD